ncbi:MAG: hypothetical protein V4615_12405 [Bacteroidota bacterium]
MKKRTLSIILFLLLGAILVTCNKKKEGPCVYNNDNAAIFIKIVDNFGNQVDSARITIFDSFEKYQKAIASKNNPKYADDSVYSESNLEVTLMTDPYVEHWILVTFNDTVQKKFLSSELSMSKVDKLQSCSDYHVTINIEPVGGIVAFWTSLGTNLPIYVQFNNKLDSLTDFTPTQPVDPSNPGSPKELIFPVKAGTYQYQAYSADGCTWTGEVTVNDGQFTTVQLVPCARARLAFYYTASSAIPAAKQSPIDIFIDNNPIPAGTLNAPYAGPTLSNSCPPATNVLYIYLEPGVSHTYKAVSPAGTNGTPCIWSSGTPVLTPDCNNAPIFLGPGCL